MTSIQLISAKPLAETEIKEILAPHGDFPATEYRVKLDPELLDGYVLFVDNRRLDTSLRRKLAEIEKQLKAGIPTEQVVPYKPEVEEIGQVIRTSDGIVFSNGLDHVMNNEIVIFDSGVEGVSMDLGPSETGIMLLGSESAVRSGEYCRRSYRTAQVPCGDAMIGRVVDALGRPLDNGPSIPDYAPRRDLETAAPSVTQRQQVNEPIYTGFTAIDAMIPIGKGQRELIIGDRQTGKTTIARDMIANQKGKNVQCIYVAVGQKMSTISTLVQFFREIGAMEYTTVVVASASESAAAVYLAPYAGCAIAEGFMEQGRDVLVIYDDLSKHAQAYRALSLLLRRPPGREAYPGDVFYIHSRLLERSARLAEELGGGSMTAIPIVETQAGDISAYIPTNIISITDGQIYLESDLFFAGQRPAINVGLSVSRVGGDAQKSVMRKTAGPLRVQLAQYRELQAFAQFGSDLDSETQRSLELGVRLTEVLKQGQGQPRSMAESVFLLQLAIHNAYRDLTPDELHEFLRDYLAKIHMDNQSLLQEIEMCDKVSEALYARIQEDYRAYVEQWMTMRSAS